MRELIVSEAPLHRVAGHAKRVVEDQGGVTSAHTPRRTEFDHLRTSDDDWARSGYIGTYQPFKQERVRIRIRVWASWPRRLFRGFIWIGFIIATLFLGVSLFQIAIPPNIWVLTALAIFIGMGLTLLTYSTSWASSQDVEDALARHLGTALQDDDEVPGDVYTLGAWQEHRADLIDEAVATVEADPEPEPPKATADDTPPEAEAEDEGDDDEEEPEEERSRSLRDKLPFLGTTQDEEAEAEEQEEEGEPSRDDGDGEASEPEEESSGGLMSKLPFGRKKGKDEDQGAQEAPADQAEPDAGDEAASQSDADEGPDGAEADADDEPEAEEA